MASAHILTVTGTVTIRERIAVPPGAVATVKLVDTEGEVLAATAPDAPGVPTEFVLDADPTLVADPDKAADLGHAAHGGRGSGARPTSCRSRPTPRRCC